MAKIKIEGLADIGINTFQCVCGYCGNTDSEGSRIEFNFREQRVIYICSNSKCKKENSMVFGKEMPPPYPRLGIGR